MSDYIVVRIDVIQQTSNIFCTKVRMQGFVSNRISLTDHCILTLSGNQVDVGKKPNI